MALGSLLIGCAAEEVEVGPPFELEVPVERSTLDNGLEVVVVPNHTAPVVTALVAIRAGSAVEDPATNGYSHLFEHMIFQGSEAVPDTREFHHLLDGLGIARNGTTSVDRVTYFFTAERTALDEALGLFAGAIIAPALDPVLLEKEKQVVLGEFDINESDADFLHYQGTSAALFGEYVTRVDPLGNREAVTAATREEMQAMHATYYVPNNAVLVLSGDVTMADAAELARRHFGDWQRAADPFVENPPPEPTALSENQYRVMPAQVSFSEIRIWWQGPSMDEDPEAALAGELLSAITFQSDHPFRGLVGPTRAYGASLTHRAMRRTSYTSVSLSVEPGQEAIVLSDLSRVLNTLGAPGDVSYAQLETAKQEAFRSYLFGSGSPTTLPQAVADDWALTDSHRFFSFVDELYGIDRAELDRFAETYIRRKPRAVVLMASPENILARGLDEGWLRDIVE